MQDRFKFRIAVFERQDDLRDWVFKEYIIDNNNWHLTMCGDIASNCCYPCHYRRDNAPDSVHRVYEAEFCTGLKDKNDKLIYEGDLLKPLGEDDDRVEVCWNDEKARFHLRIDWTDGDYWNGLYSETKKGSDYYELDDFYFESFEVIGNIYENPDLLENTD